MAWINIFLIFPFLLVLALCGDVHWKDKRKSHHFKSIIGSRLNTLATKSDPYKFDQELTPLLIKRVPGTVGSRKAKTHIEDRLKALDWHIQEDTFEDVTPIGNKTFTNIIATQNPRSFRKLVLACHYDSKYFPSPNYHFIGATDSAVPCAMMLDLARSMNKYFKKKELEGIPEVSLQFIFFDGEEAFVEWTEEDSIYGARHLAEQFEKNKFPPNNTDNTNVLHTIDVMVLLDLIGAPNPKFRNFFKDTEKIFERLYNIEHKLRGNHMLSQPGPYFLTEKLFETNPKKEFIEDDHIPFLRRNVPVVHMIPYPFPPQWHTQEDNKYHLHMPTIDDLNRILRTFVAEYLKLNI